MAEADYRLLTEATGQRIAAALENVSAMVGPPGEVSEAELTAKLADKADVIVDTASGAIASFPDGAAANARDLVIGIEPVQAGSGDPSPTNVRPISGWTGANVTRTGFNVWDEEWELGAYETNGGTKTPSTTVIRCKNKIAVLGWASYYIRTAETINMRFFYYRADGTYITTALFGTNQTITFPSEVGYITFHLTATTYNHDISINISDPAKNGTYEPGHVVTYPISWQTEAGTVYGGTLDVTTGLLTVTMAEVDLGTLNWNKSTNATYGDFFRAYMQTLGAKTNSNIVCSQYSASTLWYIRDTNVDKVIGAEGGYVEVRDTSYTDATAFKTAMSGVQLVYELATPQTYQLTPTQVALLLGQNNIWADCGDVQSLEYVADTKLYIQKINTPTDDDMTADAQIASGKYFIIGNNLYLSTTTIPAGDTITPGTNCILTNLADALNALNS